MSDGDSFRVLLVEDSPLDAALVTRLLDEARSPRFHVQRAAQLSEAVELLSEDTFDVILLDLMMPDCNGLEGLERLALDAPDLPIIVLTGVTDQEVALEALRRGAEDYLVKDEAISDALLVRSIRYGVERKRAELEIRRLNTELEARVARRTAQLRASETEQKETEEALRRAERLASIGTMAAGIAHEINNPIAAALNAAEAAMRFKDDPDAQHLLERCLDNVVRSAHRCRLIVENVLKFSRQEPTERSLVDINDVVRDSRLSALPHAEREIATITLQLADNLPPVWINKVEIEQVLTNLIDNASRSADGPIQVTVRTARSKDGIRVSVEDDGPGMSVEQRQRAFDPFYSTRQKQGGTGLGLSIAHGIVQGHNGKIEISGEPSQGTTVTVDLPTNVDDAKID